MYVEFYTNDRFETKFNSLLGALIVYCLLLITTKDHEFELTLKEQETEEDQNKEFSQKKFVLYYAQLTLITNGTFGP